jgi:hypothetical protein
VIEKVERIAWLLDFYGPLLTDKQQQCMDLHYNQDMSLGEIAAQFNVSRQAVHDLLRRSEVLLVEYEERLKLFDRFQQNRDQLGSILEHTVALQAKIKKSAHTELSVDLDAIRSMLEIIIEQQ